MNETTPSNRAASRPSTIKLLNRIAGKRPVKVLFVCLGNIYRSPAAEGMMRSIVTAEGRDAEWVIDSAGTGNYHVGDLPDRRMRVHARGRGLELTHRCRQVAPSDFDDFDLIIGMDRQNIANLRHAAPSPEAEAKIMSMGELLPASSGYDHVPDPYYEGSEGFELVLDLLEEGCRRLYGIINDDTFA